VDPYEAARAALQVERDRLVVHAPRARVALPLAHGLVVVGAGKGAAGLAAGVEAILGRRIVAGVVAVPSGYERRLARVAVVTAGHPLPDRRSRAAVRRVLATLRRFPHSAALVVLTGGASSLLAAPAPGLTPHDERCAVAWLLASGIDIAGMNTV